ncbi:hypothetical protein H6F89_15550 [Cyanobacteria bacterium FACHB-63]|nr:hypothetical protein [Cyanobacteria bacterium FACHB-63]
MSKKIVRPAEYQIWAQMKARCSNQRHPKFTLYGARGIKVCDRWSKFESFIEDMGPRPSAEYSIDRIDVDGNYEPRNCRWATPKEQNRNKRSNRFLTYQGQTLTVQGWSDQLGFSRGKLRQRLERGWDIERALTTP